MIIATNKKKRSHSSISRVWCALFLFKNTNTEKEHVHCNESFRAYRTDNPTSIYHAIHESYRNRCQISMQIFMHIHFCLIWNGCTKKVLMYSRFFVSFSMWRISWGEILTEWEFVSKWGRQPQFWWWCEKATFALQSISSKIVACNVNVCMRQSSRFCCVTAALSVESFMCFVNHTIGEMVCASVCVRMVQVIATDFQQITLLKRKKRGNHQ